MTQENDTIIQLRERLNEISQSEQKAIKRAVDMELMYDRWRRRMQEMLHQVRLSADEEYLNGLLEDPRKLQERQENMKQFEQILRGFLNE